MKSEQQFELPVEFSVDARQEEIDAVFFSTKFTEGGRSKPMDQDDLEEQIGHVGKRGICNDQSLQYQEEPLQVIQGQVHSYKLRPAKEREREKGGHRLS